MTKYRYKVCPRCQQDAIYVMQRCDNGELFLHCEECEWAWAAPDVATTVENGFLGLDIEATYATGEAISRSGWHRYGLDAVDD